MTRVYIAGAYTAPDIMGCLRNIHKGIKLATELIHLGYDVYCPWLDFQYVLMDPALTVAQLQALSLNELQYRECIMLVPGWENSKGTAGELARASLLGLPVFEEKDALAQWEREGKRFSDCHYKREE